MKKTNEITVLEVSHVQDVLDRFEKAIVALQVKNVDLEQQISDLRCVVTEWPISCGLPDPVPVAERFALRMPTFAVDVPAPKSTSPRKGKGKGTPTPTPTPTQGTIDPLAVEAAVRTVIANTRNKKALVTNVKGLTLAYDTDPRLFLTGKDSMGYRKAYKSAGVSYKDAARILEKALKSQGWKYPA